MLEKYLKESTNKASNRNVTSSSLKLGHFCAYSSGSLASLSFITDKVGSNLSLDHTQACGLVSDDPGVGNS